MWVAIGWLGVGLLAVAILGRSRLARRREERRTAQFVVLVRNALHAAGADLKGIVPGRFMAIVEVDGQETPLPLAPMYRHWSEFPADLGLLTARLVREIREDGLDQFQDFDFGAFATDLLPQIRSLDWVRAQAPAFGDGRLVHRELGADLALCYVIDDTWAMTFVCQGHLRRWGKSEADLFGLACQNLTTRTPEEVRARLVAGEPTLLRSGDGYDAARLLLLDVEQAQDLLIALPERDVLWVGAAADQGELADLMGQSGVECAQSVRPISPKLYRVVADATDGNLLTEVEQIHA